MILERVRPCVDCKRMTRPSKTKLADYPDTIPQRADCRASCCRNPYICRTGYACACHRKES